MAEKLNFANLINSTTYDGEVLDSWILKAFTENVTVGSLPASNVVDGIQLREKVGKMASSNLMQTGEHCSFNDKGDIILSEGYLEPKQLFINLELCYDDLRPIYNTLRNGGSLNDAELSDNFTSALTEELVSTFNKNWEDVVWNGVANTGGTVVELFDGFDKQITLENSGAALDASNIIAAMNATLKMLPNDVLAQENLTIYMNQKTLQIYFDALYAMGIMTPQQATAATYKGYPIVTVSKIKDHKMYFVQTSNLYVGIGAMSDFEALQILDMKKTTGDNAVRLILQARGDVLVGWAEEAVKYTGS